MSELPQEGIINIESKVSPLEIEKSNKVTIPEWFPQEIQLQISGNKDISQTQVDRIGKVLESTLNYLADEFNQPSWSKSAKLNNIKHREKILSWLGINDEILNEYRGSSPRYGGHKTDESRYSTIKAELISAMWTATSRPWERDRKRRENEAAKVDYSLPYRVRKSHNAANSLLDRVGSFRQNLLGVGDLDKFARQIMHIQPGVEDIINESRIGV